MQWYFPKFTFIILGTGSIPKVLAYITNNWVFWEKSFHGVLWPHNTTSVSPFTAEGLKSGRLGLQGAIENIACISFWYFLLTLLLASSRCSRTEMPQIFCTRMTALPKELSSPKQKYCQGRIAICKDWIISDHVTKYLKAASTELTWKNDMKVTCQNALVPNSLCTGNCSYLVR